MLIGMVLGFVGGLVLGLAIPIVRPLVLTLGSPEFFMLAVLGITFVASLSGEALLKGLLAGGLGLWLATIGLDPVTGIQRYTFGQLFLWDGIGLVPVTIGFYAIPELIEMAIAGSGIAKLDVGRVGGVWEGVRAPFRHWRLVIRCSALGTFISIIPGLGAATTQWLAYAHAVQSSPGRERFGKGAVEGVLGPGAANNSSLGGSLVTTVAFGVPASVATAILMGAFFVQGLVPGPAMLTPAPKGHLAVTLAMVWTIVVSNIITVAVCLVFMGPLARITQIRGTLLVPFIMILVYVGAFAEKNVFEDLGVVLAFGALGWVMAKLDWPRPPLLLFFFQAEDGIRDLTVIGVQTCALPISSPARSSPRRCSTPARGPAPAARPGASAATGHPAGSRSISWKRGCHRLKHRCRRRSEERRVGKECRSRWSPYH